MVALALDFSGFGRTYKKLLDFFKDIHILKQGQLNIRGRSSK